MPVTTKPALSDVAAKFVREQTERIVPKLVEEQTAKIKERLFDELIGRISTEDLIDEITARNQPRGNFFGGLSRVGRMGSDAIDFTQSGSGAVLRTMQDKARDFVSIKDFGAVGDDSTNNDTALAAAAAAAVPIRIPNGTYRFSAAVTFTKAVIAEPGVILRFTGNIPSGGALKIGHQGSNIIGQEFSGFQVDKTVGATADVLLHIRGVQECVFENLFLSNNLVNTGATNDNILTEKCWLNTFIGIKSRRAGRYGMKLQAQTSYLVDASNHNVILGGDFEDNTSAGIHITDGEHNVIYGACFEDFAQLGQHGVWIAGRGSYTVIRDCYFESQKATSNDIKTTGTNQNTGIVIEGNTHRGGPTTELSLDYANNVRIAFANSVGTGTFASVTANTDRAWFFANLPSAAATYVSDSGTLTIVWGSKAGDPVMTRLIMANDSRLQALDASGNLRNLAILQASGAMNFGDVNHNVYFDGASINFNGGLRSSFLLSTPAGAAQTACSLYAGTGVPSNANGNNGDIYFRSDGGAGTTIYQRRAGTWTATGA